MRILFINLEKGWRGGERQTYLAALRLQELGYHVDVIVRAKQPLAERLQQAGLTVKEVSGNLGLYLFLLTRGRGYQIIHAYTAGALTALSVLKKYLNAKIIYTRRTSFELAETKRWRTQRKWQQVDGFVAISEAAAQVPQQLGLEPVIIPSAVTYVAPNSDAIINFAAQHHLGGRYVLATSAALSPEKDPLTCIRAMHALWQRRQDFVFLHFGATGTEQAAAQALIDELGLTDVYRLMGFQSNIEDLYRLMHVFVLTSVSEGLGSSVLEAFLYEAPVVSTRVGATPLLLAEERGVLCEQGDFEAIAKACDQLLDDESLRQRYVSNAAAYVTTHHSVEAMVQAYLQLYQQVLDGALKPADTL